MQPTYNHIMGGKVRNFIYSLLIVLVFVSDVHAQVNGWTDGGTSVYLTTSTDKVGIGTSSPAVSLDVVNAVRAGEFHLEDNDNLTLGNSDDAYLRWNGLADELLISGGLGSIHQISDASLIINIGANGAGALIVRNASSDIWTLYPRADMTQTTMNLHDNAGNQLILGTYANRFKNYDHATTTNPTLFIHSDKNPDTDNTEWISLSYDQTDAVIDWGSGDLLLSGNDNVGIGTSTISSKLVIEQTVAADAFRVNDEANDTTPFIIDQNGNVGIGTSSPSEELEVNGDIRINNQSYIEFYNSLNPDFSPRFLDSSVGGVSVRSKSSGSSSDISVETHNGSFSLPTTIGSGSSYGGISLKPYNGTTYVAGARIYPQTHDGVSDSLLNFQTATTSDGLAIQMNLYNYFTNIGKSGSQTPIRALRVWDDDDGIVLMEVDESEGEGAYLKLTDATENTAIEFSTFGPSYFNGLGNLGIGTSSPTAKLQVDGVIRSTPTDIPVTCNASMEGGMYYDASLSEPCFCNGSSWTQFDGGGSC